MNVDWGWDCDDDDPEPDTLQLRVCPECDLGYRPTTYLGVLCNRCQYDVDFPED